MKKKLTTFSLLGIIVVALLAGAYLHYVAANPSDGVLILEYHMVNDEKDSPYAVKTEDFRQQLAYLKEQGYEAISLRQYLQSRKGTFTLPAKAVILTFDDGYADNYTTMVPLVEEYGMKATIFMVTNSIGKDGYLTWEQLHELKARGVEIGSHTANHLELNDLSLATVKDEMEKSKLMLEWNGISPVLVFSYPHGDVKPEYETALQELGYYASVSGDAGLNTPDTDLFSLQRVDIVRPKFGLWEFKLRLLKADVLTRWGLGQHKN